MLGTEQEPPLRTPRAERQGSPQTTLHVRAHTDTDTHPGGSGGKAHLITSPSGGAGHLRTPTTVKEIECLILSPQGVESSGRSSKVNEGN